MNDPWDLADRAVLVTGGGRGIGRVISERFLAVGAAVMICGRNEPETLPTVDGRSATFVQADVRDQDQATHAVTSTVEKLGGLDVLVNNAGGAPIVDAATMSPRLLAAVLSLNVTAVFQTSQAAYAVMRRAGGGAIVNIGSVSARSPSPGSVAYTTAKAGLLALSKALALEWAPAVRVNHVTAGPVRAGHAAGYFHGADEDAEVERVLDRVDTTIPMGRAASPDDVAAACLYLASPLASYVSGADLDVGGGGEYPARYLATLPQH